jgi:hypothetical protein
LRIRPTSRSMIVGSAPSSTSGHSFISSLKRLKTSSYPSIVRMDRAWSLRRALKSGQVLAIVSPPFFAPPSSGSPRRCRSQISSATRRASPARTSGQWPSCRVILGGFSMRSSNVIRRAI